MSISEIIEDIQQTIESIVKDKDSCMCIHYLLEQVSPTEFARGCIPKCQDGYGHIENKDCKDYTPMGMVMNDG